ncbi:MAG TPA: patatin-like phospholipase family protein [Burkholderiales bacterium]|nr:patatin-like phospholipase family protein [Burkholderiales bacterium]
MKRWATVASAILALGFARPSHGADVKPAGYNPRASPYALTLSGGVSLGAYEAGINWALLRFLGSLAERNAKTEREVIPDVVAITGASAGAINTLMSAISWCIDPEKVRNTGVEKEYPELANAVSKNLFYQSWVPIGKQELMPPRTKAGGYDANAYYNDDGALTRHAFDGVLGKIADIVGLKGGEPAAYRLPIRDRERKGLRVFREGCSVPLGFTVTAEVPYEQKVAGLTVMNQRHFIPLRLTVKNGGVVFLNENVDPTAPGVGNVIYLPRGDHAEPGEGDAVHYRVDNGAVIAAVLTSSAFPVAFGRRELTFCRPGRGKQHPKCGADTTRETGVFVDGGIFDNIPLGATKVLAEGGDTEADRRITYIYIDPDQTRNQGRVARKDEDKTSKGDPKDTRLRYDIGSQLAFLPGSIGSARSYELHKEMATGEWTASVSVMREEIVTELQRLRSARSAEDRTISSASVCDAGDLAGAECNAFFEQVKRLVKEDGPEARGFFSGPSGADRIARAESCLANSALGFKTRLQSCTIDRRRDWVSEREKNLEWMGNVISLLLENSEAKPIRLKALQSGVRRALNDPLGDRQVFISSRFHPIIGEYLFGFGAFFERSFREFDYYVGVYDAVHSIADKICDLRKEASLSVVGCSLNDEIQKLYALLGLGDDKDDKAAAYVFTAMLKREHPEFVDATTMPSPERDRTLKKYSVLLESLATDECSADRAEKCLLRNEKFDSFLGALDQRRKDLSPEQADALKRLAGDNGRIGDWWLGPVSEVGHRLQYLENQWAPGKKGWSQEMGWGAALADAKASEGSGFGKLSVRNDSGYAGSGRLAQALVPSELGYKAGSAGVPYVAWQWHPELVTVKLPIEAHLKQYCGDVCRNGEPWITQAGMGFLASVSGIKLGLRVPEVNYLSRDNSNGRRTGWGWSAFVGWGCLRATYGERSINGDLVTKPKDYYLDLGVRIELYSYIAGSAKQAWEACGS